MLSRHSGVDECSEVRRQEGKIVVAMMNRPFGTVRILRRARPLKASPKKDWEDSRQNGVTSQSSPHLSLPSRLLLYYRYLPSSSPGKRVLY